MGGHDPVGILSFKLLRCRTDEIGQKKIVAGYDGFIDTIARPVKKIATCSTAEELFDTIEEFGRFLMEKTNKSCSVELKMETRLPGGNMPTLAAGAGKLGLNVTCIGMLGEPGQTEEIFAKLPAKLYSFAPPIPSTCLEFQDGKVILGPGSTLSGSDVWNRIEQVSDRQAASLIRGADLLALLNWSELAFSQELWEQTYHNVFCNAECDKQKFIFFDLCDISRKQAQEVQAVVKLMGLCSQKRRTILSLNENEALVMGQCLEEKTQTIWQTGMLLLKNYGIDEVLIHTPRESILLSQRGGFTRKALFVERPIRSTGAGDHFNAASCFAAVMGLDDEERLAFANQYVSLYLKTGETPSLDETMVGLSQSVPYVT